MSRNDQTRPDDVKLVMGIWASTEEWLERALDIVRKEYGSIDLSTGVIPFDYTDYYNDEMGDGILREFVSFKELIYPGDLWRIKDHANSIEMEYADAGRRRMNLDPGYLNLSSLIVATTKDASFRVYLGNGIYAQPMLSFTGGVFVPFKWTYRDYRDADQIRFFGDVRELYRRQLKEKKAARVVQGGMFFV